MTHDISDPRCIVLLVRRSGEDCMTCRVNGHWFRERRREKLFDARENKRSLLLLLRLEISISRQLNLDRHGVRLNYECRIMNVQFKIQITVLYIRKIFLKI